MNRNDHWTDDEELRERFVLHQMDDEMYRTLEEHLASCTQCRSAIDGEMRIAAAVRRAGRDALKERIAGHTVAANVRTTPWPNIISVAALLAIVIGVGTYYRWFQSGEMPTGAVTSNALRDLDSAKTRVGDDAKVGARQPEPSESKNSPSPSFADRSSESPAREKAAAQAVEKSTIAKELPASEPSASVLAGAAREPERVDKGQTSGYTMLMDREKPDRAAYWIDGVLAGGENERSFDKQKTLADEVGRGQENAVRLQSRATMKDSRLEKKAGEGAPAPPPQYTVVQMPLVNLPQRQQLRQQNLGANTVQTEIERVDGTINITLFTDQRFDPDDIAHATVQQVGNDSLVVQLRDQMIGYRLPPGWRTK